jgi:hypothetical protein
MPTLSGEFMQNDMDPPSVYNQIDLLKVTRKQFRFPSNSLKYVTRVLNMKGKLEHKGMALWRECMAGDPKAWDIMERYNKRDVTELEKVYNKLLPWIDKHPNWGHFIKGDEEKPVCRNCGSTKLTKNGFSNHLVTPYQRYKCMNCGTPLRGRQKVRDLPQPSTV